MPIYTTDKLQERIMKNVFASGAPVVDDSRYGEPGKLVTNGRRVTVDYGGEAVQYLVPSEAEWTAGRGAIQIDKAFRIFDEGKTTEYLRKVRGLSELESVASGYLETILDALEEKTE